MNIEKFRQWASGVRLFAKDGENFNPNLRETKQGIFDAVLAELAMQHDYEWGPLMQEDIDRYKEVHQRFMASME